MTKKLSTLVGTVKKRLGSAILCGAIALTLGVGTDTVFASDAKIEQCGSILMKSENNITSFSIDNGDTWNEGHTFEFDGANVYFWLSSDGNEVNYSGVVQPENTNARTELKISLQQYTDGVREEITSQESAGTGELRISNAFSADGDHCVIVATVKVYDIESGKLLVDGSIDLDGE